MFRDRASRAQGFTAIALATTGDWGWAEGNIRRGCSVAINPRLGGLSFFVALNMRGLRALKVLTCAQVMYPGHVPGSCAQVMCTGDVHRSCAQVSHGVIVLIGRLLRTVFIVEIATKQAPNDKRNIEHRNGCGNVGEVVCDRCRHRATMRALALGSSF